MLSNFSKSGNLARLTYFGTPAMVSFSHTFMDLSLEDEMKTFVLFVSKAFISSILPMWATKDLQKEAQCKILGTGPAEHVSKIGIGPQFLLEGTLT